MKRKELSIQYLRFFLICTILYTCSFILNSKLAFAQSPTSEDYTIDIVDIDTSPNGQILTPKKTDTKPVKIIEKVITPGIKSIEQKGPISFSLSTNFIDFGAFSPGNPVTRTAVLSTLSSSIDFQILAFENHPLQTTDNQSIADATCDNGTCTEVKDALWANNLTYGFGYRCEYNANSSCAQFSTGEYFKQFSDISKDEIYQPVASAQKDTSPKTAELIFKVNASGTQKPGSYTNTVTFIAVPNF